MTEPKHNFPGLLGAAWGIGGASLLITMAVIRLTPYAVAVAGYHLTTSQWVFLLPFVVFMLITEAYLGFQLRFAPRVAARAPFLRHHSVPLHVTLAPLFCFAFFHTSPRRQVASIAMALAMVALVVMIRSLSQPWRGMVDIGVVLGLLWGLGCLSFWFIRYFRG